MPGVQGLASNLRAAASNPTAWWLARRSIVRHGAIQHVDELTEFTRIVKRQAPTTVLEIGTAEGGLFWLLCRVAARDATLISLDLPSGQRHSGGRRHDIDLESMKERGQSVYILRGDSHTPQSLIDVKRLLGDRALDLLFIDGDHRYQGVRDDYLMYGQLVRPGGLIAFHDIVETPWPECQVDRFWGELKQDSSLQLKSIIGSVPSHFGGIGLVRR